LKEGKGLQGNALFFFLSAVLIPAVRRAERAGADAGALLVSESEKKNATPAKALSRDGVQNFEPIS
jgi:hypothetical protein